MTTSRTIMRTNPKAKPMVLRFECVPLEASGIVPNRGIKRPMIFTIWSFTIYHLFAH